MEALLLWQQANYAVTQPYESILGSYLAPTFLGTKHITGAPGCYGSTGIMATEGFAITGQYRSLTLYFAHIFLGSKVIYLYHQLKVKITTRQNTE